MDIFDQIFDNNQAWVKTQKEKDPHFFKSLSRGQNPEILYVGCSDSRVTAEEMTGVLPGQMFVHRNVANLVPNNDNNSAAVIQYAIAHLNVKHVIICGHYYCGGIKSAMQSKDLGILNPWLRTIRDVYRFHKEELNAIKDEELRYKRLVELNVTEQCINVIKMAVWQKHYLKDGLPKIHALVFDVHSGELINLNFDFEREALAIREIYDLGTHKKGS
jgi:carbonic anhydrase